MEKINIEPFLHIQFFCNFYSVIYNTSIPYLTYKFIIWCYYSSHNTPYVAVIYYLDSSTYLYL